jgi:hypothetical protein
MLSRSRQRRQDERAEWESAAASAPPFGPSELSGVITAWLRVANSTVTGSGISSLPDALNANPAVQGTDAQRPALGTSGNGLSLITGASNKVLSWPLAASNNATSQWGVATHIRTPLSAAARCIFGIRGGGHGSNANRINVYVQSDESVHASIYIDDANNRAGFTASSQIGDDTVQFLTVEFDGAQAAEAAKLTVTLDGVVKALTFANEAGTGAMPSSLVAATGSALIGAFSSVGGSQPFTGSLGPNYYVLGGKMAGVTEGLLTANARTALSNFERPT